MKNEKLVVENMKNGAKEVAVRMSVCPPTIAVADAIIASYMDEHKDCGFAKVLSWDEKEKAYRAGEYSILRDSFGFSDEHYEKGIVDAALMGAPMTNDLPSEFGEVTIEATAAFEIWFFIEERKVDMLEDAFIDCKKWRDSEKLAPRTASDLNPQMLKYIQMFASAYGANWRVEFGYPIWYDLVSLNCEELIAITNELTEKALAK